MNNFVYALHSIPDFIDPFGCGLSYLRDVMASFFNVSKNGFYHFNSILKICYDLFNVRNIFQHTIFNLFKGGQIISQQIKIFVYMVKKSP